MSPALNSSFENLGRQISEKNDERRLITIQARSRKFAAVFTFIFLVLGSQTFAVLRPLFPIKPEPPLRGGVVIIGDEIIQRSSKNTNVAVGRKNERFVVRLPEPNQLVLAAKPEELRNAHFHSKD